VVVEADISSGIPGFTIVGLTDRAIQEARERVKAAVRNAGLTVPDRKLTVNLAPAELPKEGTAFDLAIAAAVLRCGGHELCLKDTALLGELALDSSLRPVAGVLPMARALRAAGVRQLVVPAENGGEAALIEGLEVVAAPTLQAAVSHLDGTARLALAVRCAETPPQPDGVDLSQVRGQAMAKRALEIAAAGRHNLLMVGPPGAGKTLLARCLASLLPDLGVEDSLEVAAVYSLRGALRERPPTTLRPPFRAPHHTISRAGLVGGGSGLAQPGELSLAHRGVLFLDEVPEFHPRVLEVIDELCEFPRSLLESLRQPLEERTVAVARARGSVVLPADIALVAAANPCPCGHLGDPGRPCLCEERTLAAYRARLSGPLLDRLDMVVSVPRQPYSVIFGQPAAEEPSTAVRTRIQAARERQQERRLGPNSGLDGSRLVAACRPSGEASRLLAVAGERLGLSARGYHRVLRVARTIADLGGAETVAEEAVAEALRYRAEAA
jgi:magnesium chelatase family protein